MRDCTMVYPQCTMWYIEKYLDTFSYWIMHTIILLWRVCIHSYRVWGQNFYFTMFLSIHIFSWYSYLIKKRSSNMKRLHKDISYFTISFQMLEKRQSEYQATYSQHIISAFSRHEEALIKYDESIIMKLGYWIYIYT